LEGAFHGARAKSVELASTQIIHPPYPSKITSGLHDDDDDDDDVWKHCCLITYDFTEIQIQTMGLRAWTAVSRRLPSQADQAKKVKSSCPLVMRLNLESSQSNLTLRQLPQSCL